MENISENKNKSWRDGFIKSINSAFKSSEYGSNISECSSNICIIKQDEYKKRKQQDEYNKRKFIGEFIRGLLDYFWDTENETSHLSNMFSSLDCLLSLIHNLSDYSGTDLPNYLGARYNNAANFIGARKQFITALKELKGNYDANFQKLKDYVEGAAKSSGPPRKECNELMFSFMEQLSKLEKFCPKKSDLNRVLNENANCLHAIIVDDRSLEDEACQHKLFMAILNIKHSQFIELQDAKESLLDYMLHGEEYIRCTFLEMFRQFPLDFDKVCESLEVFPLEHHPRLGYIEHMLDLGAIFINVSTKALCNILNYFVQDSYVGIMHHSTLDFMLSNLTADLLEQDPELREQCFKNLPMLSQYCNSYIKDLLNQTLGKHHPISRSEKTSELVNELLAREWFRAEANELVDKNFFMMIEELGLVESSTGVDNSATMLSSFRFQRVKLDDFKYIFNQIGFEKGGGTFFCILDLCSALQRYKLVEKFIQENNVTCDTKQDIPNSQLNEQVKFSCPALCEPQLNL